MMVEENTRENMENDSAKSELAYYRCTTLKAEVKKLDDLIDKISVMTANVDINFNAEIESTDLYCPLIKKTANISINDVDGKFVNEFVSVLTAYRDRIIIRIGKINGRTVCK